MNLFEAIRAAWSRETALADDWSSERPYVGHCAVTALVVQDHLGGEILRAPISGLGSHYWNRLPGGAELDMTRAQYPADLPIPRGEVATRERILVGERAEAARTGERYWRLANRVSAELTSDVDPER